MAEEQYSHARLTTAAAGTPPVQQAGHTNETYHGGVRGPFSDPKQTHTGRQSTDRRFDQSVQSITQSPNRPIAQIEPRRQSGGDGRRHVQAYER